MTDEELEAYDAEYKRLFGHQSNRKLKVYSGYIENRELRGYADDLREQIIARIKPGREKSAALNRLDECMMWVNKSLANNGPWLHGDETFEDYLEQRGCL